MKTIDPFVSELLNPKTRDKSYLKLLNTYQERLYWYIRKIVLTHENTNDVLQNTFIRVFKNIENFKHQSSLSTWLYRIAHNESLRYLEKNNKFNMSSLDEVQNDYLTELKQDPYFEGDDLQIKLHQSISKLTLKQRQVFNMKYFDDLSFKEISEILDINESTLKSAYYTAVKHIEQTVTSLQIINNK